MKEAAHLKIVDKVVAVVEEHGPMSASAIIEEVKGKEKRVAFAIELLP